MYTSEKRDWLKRQYPENASFFDSCDFDEINMIYEMEISEHYNEHCYKLAGY